MLWSPATVHRKELENWIKRNYIYNSHQNLQQYFWMESFCFQSKVFIQEFFQFFFFFFFQISQCFPQGRKQNSIIFQLVLSVTNVYFCKVLLDHQMKVTGEVENVIKKFTDLIFHRFRLHLPAKYYSSLSTVKSVTRFKMKLDCVF